MSTYVTIDIECVGVWQSAFTKEFGCKMFLHGRLLFIVPFFFPWTGNIFIYKQAVLAQSCSTPFRRFHKMTFFWSKFHDYDIHFQKDDRGILQWPVLQINQDFPVHKMFSQFWRYPYQNCYTRLKTGSVTGNAGAVGITFRCLATVSQMTWMIGKWTFISVKVFNLYI